MLFHADTVLTVEPWICQSIEKAAHHGFTTGASTRKISASGIPAPDQISFRSREASVFLAAPALTFRLELNEELALAADAAAGTGPGEMRHPWFHIVRIRDTINASHVAHGFVSQSRNRCRKCSANACHSGSSARRRGRGRSLRPPHATDRSICIRLVQHMCADEPGLSVPASFSLILQEY